LQVEVPTHDFTLLWARMSSLEVPRVLRQPKHESINMDKSQQSDYCLQRLRASDSKESSSLARRAKRSTSLGAAPDTTAQVGGERLMRCQSSKSLGAAPDMTAHGDSEWLMRCQSSTSLGAAPDMTAHGDSEWLMRCQSSTSFGAAPDTTDAL
jgi:hypothetical protein